MLINGCARAVADHEDRSGRDNTGDENIITIVMVICDDSYTRYCHNNSKDDEGDDIGQAQSIRACNICNFVILGFL